ncbi:hypothetical protein [Alishewanella phage vB_AspM_Slicko01]|nr:hypothetical protein [Alishewanella phage vB_AspM_Slicko01]
MKLLNIANNIVKGNFDDLIARNNQAERSSSVIAGAIRRKKEQLPQFDYLFIVKMPDLTIGSSASQPYVNWIDYNALQFEVDQDINHRVFAINAPNPTYDTKKTQTKNTYWYSISNKDIGQISITMDEMEDGMTLKYLNAWRTLMENGDGTYNAPLIYKRDILLIRYSGSKNELSTITYKGCFPVGMSESTYTHEGSGILQYNATFACDSVSYAIPDGIRQAIASVQQSIIDAAPAPSSGSGLNVDSAINILGRIQDLII